MANGFFRARPHFEDRQMVQWMGESIHLSGQTNFDLGGFNSYIYDTYQDFLNGVSGATFTSLPLSAATDPFSGWSNQTVYSPGIFRIIPPKKIFFSGNTNIITGITQEDVTGYIPVAFDSQGTVVWTPLSGITSASGNCSDYYVSTIYPCSTGGTVTIEGNLTVRGVTTSGVTIIETETVRVEDNNMELNWGGNHTTALGGGITVLSGQSNSADSRIYTLSDGTWMFEPGLSATTIPYVYDTSVSTTAIVPQLGDNSSQSDYTAILAGSGNTITIDSNFSTILGGENNIISGHTYGYIIGGKDNLIDFDLLDQTSAKEHEGIIGSERSEIFNSARSVIMASLDSKIDESSVSTIINGYGYDGGTNKVLIDGSYYGATQGFQNAYNNSIIGLLHVVGFDGNTDSGILGRATHNTILGSEDVYMSSDTGTTTLRHNLISNSNRSKIVSSTYSSLLGSRLSRIENDNSYALLFGTQGSSIESGNTYPVIIGGDSNTIKKDSEYSTILNGSINTIYDSASYSSIIGSTYSYTSGNTNQHNLLLHSVGTSSDNSYINEGFNNSIISSYRSHISDSNFGTILGSFGSTITDNMGTGNVDFNAIINGNDCEIDSGYRNVIVGGSSNKLYYVDSNYPNIANGIFAGTLNVISGHTASVILGGTEHLIAFDPASMNGILAGRHHTVSGGGYDTILGGQYNSILGYSISDTDVSNSILGGQYNYILTATTSTILGGTGNTLSTGVNSSIVGGELNTIQSTTGVTTNRSVILGGSQNTISGHLDSAILGGSGNTIDFGFVLSEYRAEAIIASDDSTIVGAGRSLIGASKDSGITGVTESAILGSQNSTMTQSRRSVILGGENHIMGTSYELEGMVIIGGSGNVLTAYRSVILGGQNITGTTDDTVYVPNLNIGTVGGGTPINNLGIDSSGNVVNGGVGLTLDTYNDLGNVNTTQTWDVSGTSTNYELTLTGSITLDLTNVRNGDYGTIIVEQDGVGSHTLTFGNINGVAGTHKVVNGGAGSPTLTSTPNAIDLLSFTYNGTTMYWTVGNDYT